MGAWGLLVELSLPIPLLLLALLVMPAPRKFHRGVLQLVDKTLALKFFGQFSLLHVMLILTGTAFLATSKTTYQMKREAALMDRDTLTPNIVSGNLGRKWRAERNFWISFTCFVLWTLLSRVFTLLASKAQLEDRLREQAAGRAGGAGGAAPTRPPTKAVPASLAADMPVPPAAAKPAMASAPLAPPELKKGL